jgi:hypothetical protein
MELYAGGSGIQAGRLRVRLAEYVEEGAAPVIGNRASSLACQEGTLGVIKILKLNESLSVSEKV